MSVDYFEWICPDNFAITGTITTTTTTSVTPTVWRYTATVVLGNILSGVTTIPATSFKNDAGTSVASNGLTAPGSNGYYNVFVNGNLQMGGLTTLTAASLAINLGLAIGATVSLEVVSLSAVSNSTTTFNLNVVQT
ncbi:DUF4183 domain-containing protein [Paenibacillus athensensis]|uniref:DUF4183 domain-containing protein n=1 Tax=Paenibacillus athensensis TaxID=1967502 RepID=A0A4Y8Q2C0_9BACL|nr:DUF4183 domain-containing protein [Paenibacillus athensensis]MCD1260701.1 DUF4183 domain-containing protein [Paenibacillus athensensis]